MEDLYYLERILWKATLTQHTHSSGVLRYGKVVQGTKLDNGVLSLQGYGQLQLFSEVLSAKSKELTDRYYNLQGC